jgi:hypothetical protein
MLVLGGCTQERGRISLSVVKESLGRGGGVHSLELGRVLNRVPAVKTLHEPKSVIPFRKASLRRS